MAALSQAAYPRCASLLERRTASPLVRQARLERLARRARRSGTRTRLPAAALDTTAPAESPPLALEWSCSDDAPAWSRAYLGYVERFRDDYEHEVSRGGCVYTLRVRQAPVASAAHTAEARGSSDGGLSTGSTVWDAGVVLGRYVATLPRPGERCILVELGAGTGHVGLTAAACCPDDADGRLAALVLTDLPAVLQLLEENAQRNACALPPSMRTVVLPYRWGDASDFALLRAELGRLAAVGAAVLPPPGHGGTAPPRVVCIGGDLLYRREVVQPLVAALCAFLLPAGRQGALAAEAVLSASMEHCPEAVEHFSAAARANGLELAQVPHADLHDVYRARSIVVLRVVRGRVGGR